MAGARTRVKICGFTRPGDAAAAVAAGVDAIGLVFWARSPRAVDIATAAAICRELPPFVTAVGLFVNAPATTVTEAVAQLPLGLLQFHGDESAADCDAFGLPWVKALRVREDFDLARAESEYHAASGLLLDSFRPGIPGGTGESFNWNRVPRRRELPMVLAGGLNTENVGSAIEQLRPFAVDVSGGVESEPGIKDSARMQAFIAAVQAADRNLRNLESA